MLRAYPSAAAVVASRGASLVSEVYLITGSSNGIGLECAKALAGGGATVVMACRPGSKAQAAKAQVEAAAAPQAKCFLLSLVLGEKQSIKDCAAAFLDLNLPLHGLINNAGCNGFLSWAQQTPGIETQFAVNFLGHWLLTELLHDKLAATAGARVINLASDAHTRITSWERVPPPQETYDPLRAYAFSNLCRILWTRDKANCLARGGAPYPIVCLHPGVAGGTGMLQHMSLWQMLRQIILVLRWELPGALKLQTVEQIAACQTFLAIAPVAQVQAHSGAYFNGNRAVATAAPPTWDHLTSTIGTPVPPTRLAQDDGHAAEVVAFATRYFS